MGDFDSQFIYDLKSQSWSLFAVGVFFILLRLYARAKRLGGVKNYQVDDYLQMLVLGLYTALITCLNVISDNGGSNLYPPEMAGTFTESEIAARIYGSKIVVISEQAMLNVIYTIKTCVLIMYTRLTLGIAARSLVRGAACYVAIGYTASQIAFFTACRPFSGYWGMPPPNPQCTTLYNYAIVQGCFNISSDILMLFIPLPLVFRLNVPWRQKCVLVFIFSLGAFIIIAALLTKIFNLTNEWEPTYMLWYVRESSVAVYVSNLPMIWPLLRDWVPCLRALNPADIMPTTAGLKKLRPRAGSSAQVTGEGANELDRYPGPKNCRRPSADSLSVIYGVEISPGDELAQGESKGSSAEQIMPHSSELVITDESRTSRLGGIQVEHTVIVQEDFYSQKSSLDLEKGLFDWNHAGGSKHTADASGTS